jgi:hypothetical protein
MSQDVTADKATTGTAPRGIDPRGQRVGAGITSVVLAIVVVTGFWPLLAWQALVFFTGAVFGPTKTPYSWVFKTFVRPRLGKPSELEDPEPPRFAQGVGLGFAIVGLIGYLSGVTLLGTIATAFAFVAAILNATMGFCLGCEMYLLIRRLAAR